MAISRAQIPKEIDVFEEGGDVNTTSIDNSMADIGASMMNRFQPNYEQNVSKYQERLSPYMYQAPKMSFYDLASELGAGLLSTPNTGGASAFTGLGVGFNRASERMRAAEEENRKARQQVGLQAAQMAMQDERSALEFARQYGLKNLDYRNKRGDLLTFEYTDENGVVQQKTVRDNYANDDIINELIEEKGAIEVKTPGSVVNIDQGGVSERDKEAIKRQYAAEDEILAKQRAGVASVANVEEAQAIAERLGPENFGAVEKFTLYPRKLLSGLGVTDENQEEILGDQILLSQISMGFTMDIVSRTKGAISNREMELFIQASPGLGSNYNGFMKQSEYLKRIAERDVSFFNAYVTEADRLEGLEASGELTASQVKRQLNKFEGDWYNDNLIFDENETAELESIVKGESTSYIIPEGFNGEEFRKGYREGQDRASEQKSSYSTNKSVAQTEADKKREEIKNDPSLTEAEKEKFLAMIDQVMGR